ncbi:methyl-accepting chemotaxis protein [Bacillus altitudinis]|uniref:methyl-accepting chemotaxis protein n=1 Tax=Bacillus altitudinis TaxID=293387 RepID=UPI00119D6139|nr:methyl-accepting chemotaxis protein [Bacillus altitudinis]QII23367.1 methyl-accepting chemotaxis protein [Bacillus altitudinis]
MKKKGKLRLGAKIMLIFLSVLIVFSAVVGYVVNREMTENIKQMATEKAKGDLKLGYAYLTEKVAGSWQIKDGKLYKGNTQINNHDTLVDQLAEYTGDTITIFQGNTRVATNVMLNGKRAVGTEVSPEVKATVLDKGENYYGTANVAGKDYQTAYMPIKNDTGETIGIFYTGANQSMISQMLQSFFIQFVTVLLLSLIISVIIISIFTKRIQTRLKHMASAIKSAGEGNLTINVTDHTGDELSELAGHFNKMREKLNHTILNVIKTSELVATSSEELSASAEETSAASEKITHTIQEVAQSSEQQSAQMTASEHTMRQVSNELVNITENAGQMATRSQSAQEMAQKGVQNIGEVNSQMTSIAKSIEENGSAIQALETRSAEIDQISKVITDIANQTNLLALNAAIEAARAGEHGKGFAVVADEVRKLAEESQTSSNMISHLISEIQKEMNHSTSAIKRVREEAAQGAVLISHTEESFIDIQQSMKEMADGIQHLSDASQKIAAYTNDAKQTFASITEGVKLTSEHSQQVAGLTEEQFAAMEEVTASSEALAHLAGDLKEMVSQFHI